MKQSQEEVSSNRIKNSVLGKVKKNTKLPSSEVEKETKQRVTLQEILREFTWVGLIRSKRQIAK